MSEFMGVRRSRRKLRRRELADGRVADKHSRGVRQRRSHAGREDPGGKDGGLDQRFRGRGGLRIGQDNRGGA